MDYLIKEEWTGRGKRTEERNIDAFPDKPVAELVGRITGGGIDAAGELFWTVAGHPDDLEKIPPSKKGYINRYKLNNILRVNKFLEHANSRMNNGQYLVVCLETNDSRKERILDKFPRIISGPYYCLDFILKRVFPKWRPTQRIYFKITKGRNRVISLPEGLGRLICCGFEIVGSGAIGYKTWIVARKTGSPAFDMNPTYNLIVKLRRIGKDGKRIHFYKFRTMHPYSEYLQKYLFEKHGTKDGDKIQNDFRITSWGKVFRKFWIDELPMLYNLLRRDLKIVGVRPLSEHKFYTYPKELQEKRTQVKPGLVPPFYADMPELPGELYESEERYLDSYLKEPLRTDIRYFCKAVVNILFRGARSK